MVRKNTIEIIISAKDQASGVLRGVGGNIQTVGKLALAGLGALGAGAIAAGAGIVKLALDAAPLEGIEAAFTGLAESADVGSDKMIAALKESSAGMVAQRDLMLSFNKAAQLVNVDFATKLPDAMGALGKVAAATGQDMGFLLDSLVTGVGRLSPMILDNLGIQVSLTEAVEDWAKNSDLATSKVLDNSAAIKDAKENLRKMQEQLTVANLRQGEFTEKTKESTKAAAQFKLEKLTREIAEQTVELTGLESAHGAVIESTDDLLANLTKAQQQEALAAQVMKKLVENTAAMPDVAGTASASIAGLQAKFKDTKDEIGKKFLPALNSVVGMLSSLAERVLPPLVRFVENSVVPIIDTLSGVFKEFFSSLESVSLVEAVANALQGVVSDEIIDFVWNLIEGIETFIATATPIVESIMEWVAQNIGLKDILLALGIAIASVVIPAIAGIVIAALPVIATIVGLIAVVAAVRAAWESDWQGIRTTLTNFWENTGKPTLEALRVWLGVNIPIAIETLKGFWENTLKPAMEVVWTFITDSVVPAFEKLVLWLATNIPVAIETLKTFWEEILKPALEVVWAFIADSLVPAFETVVLWLATNIPVAIEALKGFWEETLKPALETVWLFITDSLIPAFETVVLWLGESIPVVIEELSDLWENLLKPALEIVWTFMKDNLVPLFEALVELFSVGLTLALTALAGLWENTLKPALETVWAFIKDNVQPILDTLKATFDSIATAIGSVIDWIKSLTEGLRGLQLPDWLTPGSPTPFELGLRGIASAMQDLAGIELPRFQASLEAAGGGTGQQITNNFAMTVNTQAPFSTVQQDFATMAALAA